MSRIIFRSSEIPLDTYVHVRRKDDPDTTVVAKRTVVDGKEVFLNRRGFAIPFQPDQWKPRVGEVITTNKADAGTIVSPVIDEDNFGRLTVDELDRLLVSRITVKKFAGKVLGDPDVVTFTTT